MANANHHVSCTIKRRLPKVLAEIIAEYSAKPQLRDWVPKSVMEVNWFYKNPMALEAGMLDLGVRDDELYIGQFSLTYLSQNPGMADTIRANPEMFDKFAISANPALFEWLLETNKCVDQYWVSQNISKAAVDYAISKGWEPCKYSPHSVAWCMENSREHYDIHGNPGAIEYIKSLPEDEICYNYLSANPHPWAIEKLREKIFAGGLAAINISLLAGNPGIFEYRVDPEVTRELTG